MTVYEHIMVGLTLAWHQQNKEFTVSPKFALYSAGALIICRRLDSPPARNMLPVGS